jgi:hypothetical protein
MARIPHVPYTCPVCRFPGLAEPPMSPSGGGSYEICPSCGFQFGVSDEDRGETYASWRERWVADGMPWRSANPAPAGWDPRAQLRGGERGQTAAEFLGILFVVAVVVAAIFHSGIAPRLAGAMARQVDCIGHGGCPAQAASGGGTQSGGAAGAGGAGGAAAAGALATKVRDAADQVAQAEGDGWGNPTTLQDHFNRHGGDFNSSSPEEYAQQARDFFQRAVEEQLPTKVDTDGTIRIYDPATNEFGSYNPDGTTKTYFKPSRGQDYWDDQPGEDPYAADEPGTGNGGKGGDEEPGGEPPAEPAEPEVPEAPEVPEVPEIPIPEIPIVP